MTSTERPARGRQLASRVLGELGGALLVVWGAATAGFVALKLVPGDPVDVMLGVQAQVSESVKERIREDWGLNEPLLVQYLAYLGRLLRGDLGDSYQLRQPVAEVIAAQLAPTVALASLAIVIAIALSLISAVFFRGARMSRLASLTELVLVSSPSFWIGLVLIAVFGFGLHWFPVTRTTGFDALVLPAITLALPIAGVLSQVLREGLDRAEAEPFALTARARGLSRGELVRWHSLRHAASDSVTLTGYIVGSLLGGAVLVETVFGRSGLGRVTLRAVIDRDLPVVLGIIVLIAVVFAIVNALVDLLAARLDPRPRAVIA